MFVVNSTRTIDDSVFAQVSFTLSDKSVVNCEVAVFRPASEDDILKAVASQEQTQQSRVDAIAAVQAIDTTKMIKQEYAVDLSTGVPTKRVIGKDPVMEVVG